MDNEEFITAVLSDDNVAVAKALAGDGIPEVVINDALCRALLNGCARTYALLLPLHTLPDYARTNLTEDYIALTQGLLDDQIIEL